MPVRHERSPVMPHALPSFDPDFADPAGWAAMYRECGLQVVPARMPSTSASWKIPALAEWKPLQIGLVPDFTFARWYGDGGEWSNHRNMGLLAGLAGAFNL